MAARQSPGISPSVASSATDSKAATSHRSIRKAASYGFVSSTPRSLERTLWPSRRRNPPFHCQGKGYGRPSANESSRKNQRTAASATLKPPRRASPILANKIRRIDEAGAAHLRPSLPALARRRPLRLATWLRPALLLL